MTVDAKGLEAAEAELMRVLGDQRYVMPADGMAQVLAAYESAKSAEPVAWPVGWAFREGDMVRKKSGSWFEGAIVGFYSTRDTPRGYAIQMQIPTGNGPVQIFPEAALEIDPTRTRPE